MFTHKHVYEMVLSDGIPCSETIMVLLDVIHILELQITRKEY